MSRFMTFFAPAIAILIRHDLKKSKEAKTTKNEGFEKKLILRIIMDCRIRDPSMPAAQRFPDAEHTFLIRHPKQLLF